MLTCLTEIWRRPDETWRTASQSSPDILWEKAASTHSKECYPNLQTCVNSQSCPFNQWHTCILWSFLLGVFPSGWVVSIVSKFLCCVLVPHIYIFFFNTISYVVCSTLVIKQKLPGIYVQPSYKSALSKSCSSDVIFICWDICFILYINPLKQHVSLCCAWK